VVRGRVVVVEVGADVVELLDEVCGAMVVVVAWVVVDCARRVVVVVDGTSE
jgi:NaMN:DMB phosphoribosyltransferase